MQIVTSADLPESGDFFLESSLKALLDGCFDGTLSFADLARHGDFGLGTFQALDGEMVAVDGEFYQVTSDAVVRPVDPAQKTPFSMVVHFAGQQTIALTGPVQLRTLQAQLGLEEDLYALRIPGTYSWVRCRAVDRCRKPYPPLGQATQREFERRDVEGELIGFLNPAEASSLVGPALHLHFLSRDRSFGGHVLDFRVNSPAVQVHRCERLHVHLPPGREGDVEALTPEQLADMHRVEFGRPAD